MRIHLQTKPKGTQSPRVEYDKMIGKVQSESAKPRRCMQSLPLWRQHQLHGERTGGRQKVESIFNIAHSPGQPHMPVYSWIHPLPKPHRWLLRALREPQLPSSDTAPDRPMQPNTLWSWDNMQRARRECHLPMPRWILSKPGHYHRLQARV